MVMKAFFIQQCQLGSCPLFSAPLPAWTLTLFIYATLSVSVVYNNHDLYHLALRVGAMTYQYYITKYFTSLGHCSM